MNLLLAFYNERMANTAKVKRVYNRGFAKTKNYVDEPRLAKTLNITKQFPNLPYKTFLDLGCGDGFFTVKLANAIGAQKIHGIDISQQAVKMARMNGVDARALDIDEKNVPYKSESIDFIFCGNLIELVADADHLLEEIHRTLKKDGTVIMTFPNIAAWLSRIALFLGYLPFYSRVSTQFDLGKMFSKIKKGQSTGFIRLFTLSSFIELTKCYGLSVKKTYGVAQRTLPLPFYLIDSFVSKKPSLASQIICVLTKA